MKRRLGFVTGFLAVAVASMPPGAAAQTCTLSATTGMAVPAHGMDLGSGMDSPLFIGEHYGLGFACGSTSIRVEREFALGGGAGAPWIVVSGRAGRMEFRSGGSRHTGVAAGAGVQFGLRFARPWSVLLHLGIKTNRLPRETGGIRMVTALPMGVGVRFNP